MTPLKNYLWTLAVVLLVTTFQLNPVYGDDPGNVPPGTPDCTPDVDTVWDPIDPSYGTHQVPQETNRTYCADGSLARIYGDIYHYQLFKEFEVTDYPSDSSCPADTRDATGNVEGRGGYIQVDRDVELPSSPGINGSVCGGSGDDDDDDDDDDGDGGTGTNCYTLSESSRDVTADNFCNKYYTPRVYDGVAVTELPNKNGLNILYEVVYEWIPRRGFTSIDYERPDNPDDYLTYNTRTYSREISSGCVEGNGSGQSKYEYKPASWDYCGTFTGYTHRIPSNGVYQEGLSGQSPDGLSEWRVSKHSYGGDKSFNVKYTTTYSDPYTSSAFRTDAVSAVPAFDNVFSRATTYSGNISASLNLTHIHLYCRKVKFKFKWGDEVENEDKYPVEYFVIFTPEDDPSTEDVDESEQAEIIDSIAIDWPGDSGESPVYTIDPGAIDASKDGTYKLIEVDMEVVDRDDPTNAWGDEERSSTALPIYSGEFTGDMVCWSIGNGLYSNLDFTWTAEGPNGEKMTGPTGVGKDEWKIANGDTDTSVDWLAWKPGKWNIKVQLSSSELEFEQEIGWRTEDFAVIGQIVPTTTHDNDAPPLIAVGDNFWDITSPVARYRKAVLFDMADLPLFDGIADSIRDTITITPLPITEKLTEAWFGYWYVNPLSFKGPFTSSHLLGLGNVEYGHRFWAMQHVFKVSPDSPLAPQSFSPTTFDTLQSEDQYRVIHRYMIRFLVTTNGKIDSESIQQIKHVAETGPTKMNFGIAAGEFEPLWNNSAYTFFSLPTQPSETNEHNAIQSVSEDRTKVSYYATGRVGPGGQNVNWRLVGKDAPWIFSEIIFKLKSDRSVATEVKTSVDTSWSDTGAIDGDNPFNNLNLYQAEVEQLQDGSFTSTFIRQKLFPMEGELEDFINSASGERPEAVIPPSVQ